MIARKLQYLLQHFARQTLIQILFFSNLINSLSFLVKTKETFKLADLQLLEAQLQIDSCDRIVVDSATGSSLLYVPENVLPSSFVRYDWIGEILVRGKDPTNFLEDIQKLRNPPVSGWKLDYTRFNSSRKREKKNYTSKMLLICVAKAIQSSAELCTSRSTLMVIEANDELFLARILPKEMPNQQFYPDISWSKRPFQYSSSINFKMAEIIIDILLHLVPSKDEKEYVKLLDPTCGSGTFLALGLTRKMKVQGWDLNESCVRGATQNLEFYFSGMSNDWTILQRDATEKNLNNTSKSDEVDCVVANLPWGRNTILYNEENTRILEQLKTSLKSNTPCAFVSKSTELQADMKKLGFSILGFSNVPQKNFSLPKSKNKKFEERDGARITNGCVVTIAMSPK